MSAQELKPRKPLGSTEKALFAYLYFNPGSTIKEAASACHVSYAAAKKAMQRLRRFHNVMRLCPVCFNETLYDGVCHTCGFESDRDQAVMPGYVEAKAHEPVFKLMPGGGLGTIVNYNEFHFRSGASTVKHLVEHGPGVDRKFEALRAELLQRLNGEYREEALDFAARLLKREYNRFVHFYPDLLNKHGFNDMILNAVERQLLIYLGRGRGDGQASSSKSAYFYYGDDGEDGKDE